MPRARRSLRVWAVYVFVLGAVLMLVPNTLLGLFGIAETEEPWIRVLGMTVVVFGFLYTGFTWVDARPGYLATILGRGFAVVALVALAATTGHWQLVLFAAMGPSCVLCPRRGTLRLREEPGCRR